MITRLLKDESVTNVEVMKYDDRGPRIEISYVVVYDMADADVQADLKWSGVDESGNIMRLRRWFGEALDSANGELLAHDGVKGTSWKRMGLRDLFKEMVQHCEELRVAIAHNKHLTAGTEAIDVVNYALMIATRCSSIVDGSCK